IISLSREPYEAKVSRTGLTGGMGRRTVRQRALCLPSGNSCRLKTGYNTLISPPIRGGCAMVSPLFFYQLTLIALVWLCLMLHCTWPSAPPARPPLPAPLPPRPKRTRAPPPMAGLTTKPHCDACEHTSAPHPHAPSAPPPRIVMTRGRRRQVDTSHHFCPNPD